MVCREWLFKTDKEATERTGEHFIKVYISYDIGNSSGYHETKRGYTLHCQPVGRRNLGNYISEFCIPTNGYKLFILEVTKKSSKAESQAIDLAREVYKDMLARVCTAENCTIIGDINI